MSQRSRFIALKLALVLLAATGTASEVVYREAFNHGKSFADVGWTVHTEVGARDASARSAIGMGPGNPRDVPPVGSSGDPEQQARGFCYVLVNGPYLLTTEEARVRGAERVSFSMLLKHPDDSVRVALRVDGRWYLSATTFADEGTPEPQEIPQGRVVELSIAETAWIPVDITLGGGRGGGQLPSDIAGEPAPLPAGPLEAAGIYAPQRSGGSHLFDSFAIHGEQLVLTPQTRAAQLLTAYHSGVYQSTFTDYADRWETLTAGLRARGPRANVPAWNPELDVTPTGTAFYVHADLGDDAHDGLTPATAFRSLPHACAQLSAGDTLVVGPGHYYPKHLAITGLVGTAERPIHLRAEPRGAAVLSRAWADAAEGLVTWTDEGDGLFSAPFPTRSDGEDQRAFGGWRDADGTPWFLFGYRSLADLLAPAVATASWDKFGPNKHMPKPAYGFALERGRAWLRLPADADPNAMPVIIASYPTDDALVRVTRSPHVVWDGFTFQGCGQRALRSDRASPHHVFRNIVVEWCRNGIQPDSHSVIEWCEFTHPGYKRFADELERLVADAGHRTVNPMFGFVKKYHSALTEGHLAARPWTGERNDPPAHNVLRHCLFFETFDGWNMGWQDSQSHSSVYLFQYDNAVELDAGPTPVRNIHFHDNLILAAHYGAISQYMPTDPAKIEQPLGPQYVYRNVIIGHHAHAWHPWTISKFWTTKATGMHWYHNVIWMRSGGLVWQRGHEAEAAQSHAAMSWRNNVLIFEDGFTHQTATEHYLADGNALVAPTPRPSLTGANGLHVTSITDLGLRNPSTYDVVPRADSPLVGAAVELPADLPGYRSNTIGPFAPGEAIGSDWPRPHERVYNRTPPAALTGSEAEPDLISIPVQR